AARPAAAPRRQDRPAATASGAAAEVAELAVGALRAAREVLHRDAEALGRLDAVAGDGDHGRGMYKGVDAALAAAEKAHADRLAPAAVLSAAGDAWAAEAGGTSGALWGVALRAVGDALPADRAPDRAELASAATAALTAVTSLGGAEVGDKTLVDALAPFAAGFAAGLRTGAPVAEAYRAAAAEARTAAEKTAELRPRLGRARPLAERSVGTPDPGATSLAAVLTAVATLRPTTGSETP
ncbi:DAK2 domain-containing protein, partial [Streptomyces sp. SRF1]|uniref:DAK2 domain-containing protein n=1 Tax=Streptomyces sp. SRF1 TaxID=1549642 RepID=UPI0025B08F72